MEYIGEEQSEEKQVVENDEVSSEEEAFMQGYHDDENVDECAECGSAIQDDKKVSKEMDGEKYEFCSKTCAEEFEEGMGEV
jgi:hypothetical protein